MATNYAKDVLINMSDEGMTEELWELAHGDAGMLSELGAKSDRERNLYFYLDNFYEDLVEEFELEEAVPKEKVLACAFAKLRDEEKVDLTDIRRAVHEALQNKETVAYPNNIGIRSSNKGPLRDIAKWIQALASIYAAMKRGKGRAEATQKVTEGWDPMEKFDFEGWARYYENGDQEKYNLQKSAAEFTPPSIPFKGEIFEEEQKPEPESKPKAEVEPKIELAKTRRPGRPRKVERTVDDSKRGLISRLDSARKLLREFANVWPVDKWTHLDEMLSFLQREIIPLKTATTMQDCIIRTANKLEKEGFYEGAHALRKVAQPPAPAGDVASQIEKALTGREYESKKKPEEEGMPPMEEMMGGMEELPPPPPAEEGAEEGAGVPAGVEEKLPPPEAPPPPPEEEAPPEAAEGGPFEGKTVKDVLGVLEPLAQKLSEREFVRELSKADMMLDGLNIASHFPELGEAQAKALELNLYVATRIEKIINKLKGGLKEEGEEGAEAPSVEMKEEEMFEVEEEEAPVPAETAAEMAAPPPEAPPPEAPPAEGAPPVPGA